MLRKFLSFTSLYIIKLGKHFVQSHDELFLVSLYKADIRSGNVCFIFICAHCSSCAYNGCMVFGR